MHKIIINSRNTYIDKIQYQQSLKNYVQITTKRTAIEPKIAVHKHVVVLGF